MHHILLTGVSGYLGGDLLDSLTTGDGGPLPPHKLYALVRSDAQADAVRQRGAEPLRFDPYKADEAHEAVVANGITVVCFLIDALRSEAQVNLIKALAESSKATGLGAHFIHTTGAKVFSSHAGAPTDRRLLDDEDGLYDIQKAQKSPHAGMQLAIQANCTVIEQAKAHGVRSYIFAPCIVYGKSGGFGKQISIQTTKIVQAATALKRVYRTDTGRPTWPVSHVRDNSTLWVAILRQILDGKDPGHDERGYYLAASGDVVWDDLYDAMASALKARGVIDDASVALADDQVLQKMGAAIERPKEFVPVELGGLCTFTAKHGGKIGWRPQYPATHILEAADEEVERILQSQ